MTSTLTISDTSTPYSNLLNQRRWNYRNFTSTAHEASLTLIFGRAFTAAPEGGVRIHSVAPTGLRRENPAHPGLAPGATICRALRALADKIPPART